MHRESFHLVSIISDLHKKSKDVNFKFIFTISFN